MSLRVKGEVLQSAVPDLLEGPEPADPTDLVELTLLLQK